MTFITDIIANVPELSTLEFFLLCLASFFTSTITAAFGLGGGAVSYTHLRAHETLR